MRRLMSLLMLLALMVTINFSVHSQADESYVVQPGDNLYRLSLRFGVSVRELAEFNNLENVDKIFVGQTLLVPNDDADDTPTAPTMTPTPMPTPTLSGNTYTIQRGDTLLSVAQRFNISVADLAEANGITNLNLIFSGQTLQVPGDAVSPEADSTPSVAVTPDAPTPAPPTPTPTPAPAVAVAPVDLTAFQLGGEVFQADYPFGSLMRETGLTWAKRSVQWDGDAPASDMAAEVAAARNSGFRLLLSITGEPSDIAAGPADYYENFAAYLAEVAALGVDAIEVWTTPNVAATWPEGRIDGGAYTEMLRAAYPAIKARNPNTVVVSAAPLATGRFDVAECEDTGCNDNIFINQMRNAGAAEVLDCVGLQYVNGAVDPQMTSGAPVDNPEHYSWYYGPLTNLYRGQFPSAPLCFTRVGYLSDDDVEQALPPDLVWAEETTIANHAQWLAQATFGASNRDFVSLFIIHNVDADEFGADAAQGYAIVRPDGTCPACTALSGAFNE